MPVVMYMEWDGVTPAQYDEARAKVEWESDVPDGAILHVPWFVDGGLRVTDRVGGRRRLPAARG